MEPGKLTAGLGAGQERTLLRPLGVRVPLTAGNGYSFLRRSRAHPMLGITLGPASGQSLAEFVMSGRRPAVLEPFQPRRFSRASLNPG